MSTRRQFMTSAAFTGMAVGVAAAASGRPLTGFRKFLEPMIQAANLQSYHDIVRNTSSFKFSGNDAEDVRKFLENGGMYRTEKRPASKKDFASVLYFDRPAAFMVGTDNAASPAGGQKTVGQEITLAPGIYPFNYDTEAGLTIRMSGSEKEMVQIAVKPSDPLNIANEPSVKVNVTNHAANLSAVKKAIESTISLYGSNPSAEMAVLMEMALDCLYRDGNRGRSAKFLESYQSDRGKLAAKETARSLMSNMEESAVRGNAGRIAGMTESWPAWIIAPNIEDTARREYLLTNSTVDNLLVSFEVEGKRGLVAVVHNGTGFETGSSSYNPVLQYRISGGNAKGRVDFPNSYDSEFRGFTDGRDYDNSSGQPSEQAREGVATEINQRATNTSRTDSPNEVKLFVVNINANSEDLLALFSDAYRRHEGK